jgi:uncharacterized protein with HEPN domain
MKKDDKIYLLHIQECIRRIEEDTAPGRERFSESHTIQDAVLRNFQTLAESTQRLSEAFKAKYPETEWRRISAFRNILVHNYLGIDLEVIWRIVEEDVPRLKQAVQSMLEEIDSE